MKTVKQSEIETYDEGLEENIYIEIDLEQALNFRPGISCLERCSSTKGQSEAEEEDWTDYNPSKLRTQKSEKLHVRQSDTAKKLQYKICTWATSKNEIAALQKKSFSEEHQLKLEQMREKHEQYIKIQSRMEFEKDAYDRT